MSDESVRAENVTEIRKWKDIECVKIATKQFFPDSVTALAVQKVIITRFLNFYLGGRKQKGIAVEDLVFAVLSIMPVSPLDETIAWHSGQFRRDGKLFFLSSEEKNIADENKNIFKTGEPVNVDLSEEEREPSPQPSTSQEQHVKVNDDIDTIINGAMSQSDKELLKNISASLSNVDITRAIEEQLQFYNIQIHETTSNDNNIDEDTSADETEAERDEEHSYNLDALLYGIQSNNVRVSKRNVTLSYGPAQNAAFNTYCNKVLANWESQPRGRVVLKCFFAVVALVLMRATAKSYKHLVSTFHSSKFLDFLTDKNIVPVLNGQRLYFPPHKRCFKSAFRTFCKKADNTPVMFAKLVILSDSTNSWHLKSALRLLLNYTADYGFNLVRVWQIICTKVKSKENVRLIVQLTTCEETKSSWDKLINFFSKYKCSGCEVTEKYYHWARVLDPRYFKELSCLENYKLAVILTVFAEKLTGDPSLWGSKWVENDELENSKQIGLQRYQNYVSLRINN